MNTWDNSITDCGNKYDGDLNLCFFPVVNVDNVTQMEYMF
jgi:hypothetical protein